MFPGTMGNDQFPDARAAHCRNCRNEAMHVGIESEHSPQLAPVGLQGAAIVMDPGSDHFSNQPVGHLGRKIAIDPGVLPVSSPATNQVVALFKLLQEKRDVAWI